MGGQWAGILALILGGACKQTPALVGSDARPGPDAGPDAAQVLGDAAAPRLADGGPGAVLVAPGPDRDAGPGRDADQPDAAQVGDGGAGCSVGWYDCDDSPGCEWDACLMVPFLNSVGCGSCGGVEVCGCGPSVTKNRAERCQVDCPGR
jgi:hypothetical protein